MQFFLSRSLNLASFIIKFLRYTSEFLWNARLLLAVISLVVFLYHRFYFSFATLLLDLFLLYRSLYYARSFGFAFVGFIHIFILFLRVFFSFLPGIAAVLGFTSICISMYLSIAFMSNGSSLVFYS